MRNKKGFTMIEIIVVTLIIATLALLVAPSFRNSQMTANIEKAKIGLVELNTAVKLYYEVNPSDDISGDLISEGVVYQKLTKSTDADDQGYTYLHNPGRWKPRPGGSELAFDGLNCKYRIGESSSVQTTTVTCRFTDDENTDDCYIFFINKNNPALVQRTFGGLNAECENM